MKTKVLWIAGIVTAVVAVGCTLLSHHPEIRLQVVHDGKPVEGAEVSWEKKGLANQSIAYPKNPLGLTDAEGRTSFPKPSSLYKIHIHKGDLWMDVTESGLDPSKTVVVNLIDLTKLAPEENGIVVPGPKGAP